MLAFLASLLMHAALLFGVALELSTPPAKPSAWTRTLLAISTMFPSAWMLPPVVPAATPLAWVVPDKFVLPDEPASRMMRPFRSTRLSARIRPCWLSNA